MEQGLHEPELALAVFISGRGSNLSAIIEAINQGRLAAKIQVVVSDRPEALGLQLAQQQGIATEVIKVKDYPNFAAYEQELLQRLAKYQIDLIVLAGFMRILTKNFIQHYPGRILNIHPSLLPLHKGLHTHAKVLAAGDKVHGCTVHIVTEELDGGPILAQAKVAVFPEDTEDQLQARVLEQEHKLYAEVIGWFAAGRVQFKQGKLYLDDQQIERQ